MAEAAESRMSERQLTIGSVMLTAYFCACLYPLSANGIGVNYAFVLLPLMIALSRGRLQDPGSMLLSIMTLFALIFFCACLYQFDLVGETGRRLVSFAVFMSMFSYTFIKVDEKVVTAFKAGLVCISIGLSIFSIYEIWALGAAALGAADIGDVGSDVKDLIGSQRTGFIYLLAIWLVLLPDERGVRVGILRYPIIGCIGAGLLLTFSRASIVALLASLGAFALTKCRRWLLRLSVTGLLKALSSVVGAAVLVWILYQAFPLPFDFFADRLFGFFSDSSEVQAHLEDQSSSEGTRVVLLEDILQFVSHNPLTGAGYLGVWVLPNAPMNSAHNQYTDVLFRTGFTGFVAYAFMLLIVLKHLVRRETALFWGVTGVLVYGLFHETFKESQGACIFAFLLGMTAQAYRESAAPGTARVTAGPPSRA